MKIKYIFFSCLLVLAMDLHAYSLQTHANMTHYAYVRSNLGANDLLLKDLGLDIYGVYGNELNDQYFDMSTSNKEIRHDTVYDNKYVEKAGSGSPLLTTVQGWFIRGVVREDDQGAFHGWWITDANPGTDPDQPRAFWRSMNHFYDPAIEKKGLTIDLIGLAIFSGATGDDTNFRAAPDWAFGTNDAFQNLNEQDTSSLNHFTWFDAREAMYRALTGKKAWLSSVPIESDVYETQRRAYWATTFRALGDVVHLLEDMAQPQHTRNEAHLETPTGVTIHGLGHASKYEARAESRAIGPNNITTLPAMHYDTTPSYPIPRFADPLSYFTTQQTGCGIMDCKGLADYSNRGFFTIDHNMNRAAPYDYPSTNVGSYSPSPSSATVLNGTVHDSQVGGDISTPLTARGALDDALKLININNASFTLNDTIYDANADLLIPRAVAYSAGLINHFFRGKMQISLPDAGVYGLIDKSTLPVINPDTSFKGFNTIKFKVQNTTPSPPGQSAPEEMNNGTLEAVIKFHRTTCTEAELSAEPPQKTITATQCRSIAEEIVVSDPISISSSNEFTTAPREFTFNFPDKALPINAIDVYLQAVYKGQLGNETQAVVVATKDISEPSSLTILNSSDYIATVYHNQKAYLLKELNNLQLTEIQTDLSLSIPIGSPWPDYCIIGTAGNLQWDWSLPGGQCIPDTDPNIKIFDVYSINNGAPNNISPIKITLNGLPQKDHATIVFLTDTSGDVTLVNKGMIDLLGTYEFPFQDLGYPHVICGKGAYPICHLNVNQTQFSPTSTLLPTRIGNTRDTYGTGSVLNVFYTDVIIGINGGGGLYKAVYISEDPSGELLGAFKTIDDQMSLPAPASALFPVIIQNWP